MKHLMTLMALVLIQAVDAQDYPQYVSHFPGDLTNDSLVGADDLMALLAVFGTDYVALLPPNCEDDVVFDFEGYSYELVSIGDQCWFAENLRTEHYANGDAIPGGLGESEWSSTTDGAQAIFGEGDGSEELNLANYGRLYNWYAIGDERGLCPAGWMVPSDLDWIELEMELGMSEMHANSLGYRGSGQGSLMKSSPADDPGWNGTNDSGFSGLPGGQRTKHGHYQSSYGWWWTSSPTSWYGDLEAWRRTLYTDGEGVERLESSRSFGFSVRCVRDY